MIVSRYNDFLARVIEWNRVAKNGHKFDDDAFRLQRSVTQEELDETVAAIELNDEKETIDGIADIFVTAGYLAFMKTKNTEAALHDLGGPIDVAETLKTIEHSLHSGPSHHEIQKLYVWAAEAFGEEKVEQFFERVLSSNESKFVPVDQWSDAELELATKKYADRGFKNIVAVDGNFNGTPVKILRADYGKGKILKPSTFIEP